MDRQVDLNHVRNSVKAMIGREGRVHVAEYLASKNYDERFRLELVKAGILVGEEIDFSEVPIRKSDLITSPGRKETMSIVKKLIERDGIDYTILDLSNEPNQQIHKNLMEARLMFKTPNGTCLNVSGIYQLANFTEKTSKTDSIQSARPKSSPR